MLFSLPLHLSIITPPSQLSVSSSSSTFFFFPPLQMQRERGDSINDELFC